MLVLLIAGTCCGYCCDLTGYSVAFVAAGRLVCCFGADVYCCLCGSGFDSWLSSMSWGRAVVAHASVVRLGSNSSRGVWSVAVLGHAAVASVLHSTDSIPAIDSVECLDFVVVWRHVAVVTVRIVSSAIRSAWSTCVWYCPRPAVELSVMTSTPSIFALASVYSLFAAPASTASAVPATEAWYSVCGNVPVPVPAIAAGAVSTRVMVTVDAENEEIMGNTDNPPDLSSRVVGIAS